MQNANTREFCEFVREAASKHSKWFSVPNDFSEHWSIEKSFKVKVPVSGSGTVPHMQEISIEIPDEENGVRLRNIVGDNRENITKAWTTILALVGRQIAEKADGDFDPELLTNR